MNDPFILYAIASFADTSILLNLVRASRQFHALVAENAGVRYDLMDCYAADGYVKFSDGTLVHHGKFDAYTGVEYWRAGQLHRNGDLPALKYYSLYCWFQNGKLHRDGDLPAWIYDNDADNSIPLWYVESKFYKKYGIPHWVTFSHIWFKNGKIHRDGDRPAIVCKNGDQAWYIHGERHREGDFPALIKNNGAKYWLTHGMLHREGGLPAAIYRDGTKEFYYHGQRVAQLRLKDEDEFPPLRAENLKYKIV